MAFDLNFYPGAPGMSSAQYNKMGNNTGIMSAFNAPMGQAQGRGGLGSIGGTGLGFNMDTLQLGLGGLSAIGNFWNAYQANSLAKKQFAFSKQMAETNLANQIKSYNTALEDRGRARAAAEAQSPEEAQAYIDKNRL